MRQSCHPPAMRASGHERFKVDGANLARDLLQSHGIDEGDIETVWTAIGLHTTPGNPQHTGIGSPVGKVEK